MERVKVHAGKGPATRDGVGVFAEVLMRRMPLLPVEEEGRLNDLALRETFVERIFAYRRLLAAFGARWTVGDLVRFHTAEKLLLLAHEPEAYRRLGQARRRGEGAAARRGGARVRGGVHGGAPGPRDARESTRTCSQHMAGYFKDRLRSVEKAELHDTIGDYRRGLVPLVVPLTLLRHHLRLHGAPYLEGQAYLEPHPKELMLRNHA